MKLDTHILGKALKDRGFAFYCGVPCSFLSDLINYTINEAELVMSSNEGDAVAAAAGAYLAGKKAVVFMQNSGLTNAISPLTSLNYPFRIPVLGFVSLRGEPGLADEPQHELMGTITEKMLDLVEVKWEYLAADIEEARDQLDRADRAVEKGKPFFFVVRKGSLGRVVLKKRARKFNGNKVRRLKAAPPQQFRRFEVLETLHRTRSGDTVLLASTGKIGRELYEVGDVPGNLYMVGSMGSVSSLGLGMALNSKNPIIAIDGDGALLMRMGNLAVNGCYAPRNFLHLLIDNNAHDSTGGQFTVSHNVDFVSIAAGCGYTNSLCIHSLKELEEEILRWRTNPVLSFFYVKVIPGAKENLGRPKIKPHQVKERLMEFLRG